MGYNKPNPLKMMESALKMYKAEKKGGMHRMESPMYAKEASRELKDMPIVDIEKGDAKGSPAKAAKPDYIDIDNDGNTTESMKDAAKAKGSPAKMGHKKDSPAKNMNKGYGQEVKSPMKRQGYNDKLDESLAKDGKESSKKQSMKDRRDESKGMEKSKGKGAYSSDPKMS